MYVYIFSSLREDRRPLASWRIDTGAGCTALGDLVFGIFSDSSWTAFGRLSERSRSYAKVAQKVLELALEFTEQVASKRGQEASKRRPRDIQVGPRGVQVGPRGVQEAQEASTRRPSWPERRPSWPKRRPRAAKRRPRADERRPRAAKRRPRAAKFGPKDVQELAKTLQEAPSRAPRGVQERQDSCPSAIRQQARTPCKNHCFPKEN